MEILTTPSATVVDIQNSGVSWPAIASGAIGAAALSLVLASLGAGLGLSVISPWPNSSVSTTTFNVGAGIYLCCTAVMASAVGGYLAARLRTKWIGIRTNEVFFRDTAHGFLAWAFATVLLASVLGAATSHITSGVLAGAAAGQAAQNNNPAQVFVDRLFRTDGGATRAAGGRSSAGEQAATSPSVNATRAEVLRLWTASFRDSGDLSADDRTYVAGSSQRAPAEPARSGKACYRRHCRGQSVSRPDTPLNCTILVLADSLAAPWRVRGKPRGCGRRPLRDGTWNDRVLTPRAI